MRAVIGGLLIAIVLAVPGLAAAVDLGSARSYMQAVGEETVEIMRAPDLSREARQQQFGTIFSRHIDTATVGRFVLGRYWRSATPEQQTRFIDLSEAALLNSFGRRFSEFSAVMFEIGDVRAEGDSDAFIAMTIDRQSGPPINTMWRLRERDSSFKILDVYVEGVSMAISLRDEYSSYIANHGGAIDALLEELGRRAGN